ncbi:hypothetical protein K440DRAFT_555835, partial [Wilcoxina mikolae CBS 423.85]
YEYIRKNTNYNSPVTNLTSPDLRCNVGAVGARTATTTVAAGATVKFSLDIAVYHQGPIMWYLGKAPGKAESWDGSGEAWVKVCTFGPSFASGQAVWPMTIEYDAVIPKSIPSGNYLLRIEQLALHNPGALPQFFISCAQITITGGGNANPKPFAIPGHILSNDPGYTVNIYNNFKSYSFPGPAVWSG